MKTKINVGTTTEIKEFAFCLNFIMGLLFDHTEKNVFSVDQRSDFPGPQWRFDLKDIRPGLDVDRKMDVIVITLNQEYAGFLTENFPNKFHNPNVNVVYVVEDVKIFHERFNFNSSSTKVVYFLPRTPFENDTFEGFDIFECPKKNSRFFGVRRKNTRKPSSRKSISVCSPPYWPPNFICWECQGRKGNYPDILDMFMDKYGVRAEFNLCTKPQDCISKNSSHVRSRECDVLVKTLLEIEDHVDFIAPVFDDYDYLIVPRCEEIPVWKYLFIAIPPEVAITAFLMTFVLIPLVIVPVELLFQSLFLHQEVTMASFRFQLRHIGKILSIIFKLNLEQSGNLRSLRGSHRIILCSIFFLTFNMTIFYKTRFTYLLLGDNFYSHDVTSMYEAYDQGMYVTYPIHLRKYLQDRFPDIREYFESHYRAAEDDVTWIKYVAFEKDTVAVKVGSVIEYLKKLYLDENGRSLLEVLPEQLKKSSTSFHFLKGHLLLSKFPSFILRLRDHGFLDYITSKYQLHYSEKRNKIPKKLGIIDFEGPIYNWVVGTVMAIICIILEIIHRRI